VYFGKIILCYKMAKMSQHMLLYWFKIHYKHYKNYV
jgi:hypothetical protein